MYKKLPYNAQKKLKYTLNLADKAYMNLLFKPLFLKIRKKKAHYPPPHAPRHRRKNNRRKNNKGFSLIEILMGLVILGIVSGIATVSYSGYDRSVIKSTLKNHAELFVSGVQNCIANVGGWEINHPTAGVIYPCDPSDNNDSISDKDLKDNLKSYLKFTCPKDAECKYKHRKDSEYKKKYMCLSIQHTKGFQTLVRIPYNNSQNYEIWCGEPSTFVDVSNGPVCRKGAEPNLINKGLKKDCIWD